MNQFPSRLRALESGTERLFQVDYAATIARRNSVVRMVRNGTISVLTNGDAGEAAVKAKTQLPCEAGHDIVQCLIVNVICLGERKRSEA